MSRAHWSETPSPRIAYRGSVKRLRQLSAALVVAAGALAPVAGAAGAPPPRTASGPASGPVHGLGQMGVAITTVTWAGYSIALPEAFAQRSAKNCFTDKGSFVIVGSYRALGGCMSLGPLSGTTVLLGQGGPAGQGLAGQVLVALGEGGLGLVLQLVGLALELGGLELDPLLGRGHVGHAATDLLEVLQELLVGEVE